MRRNFVCLLLITMILLSGCHSTSEPTNPATTTTTTTTIIMDDTTHGTGTTAHASTTSTDSNVTATSSSKNTVSSTSGTVGTPFTKITTTVKNTATKSTIATTTGVTNDSIIFKATIRENVNRQPIEGVTVTVFTDSTTIPAGSGVTNLSGVVQVNIPLSTSYKVVLDNLPAGYEAKSYYLFSTATVNITINKSSVRNEDDHSNALYKKGDVMTDFKLTDTEGNHHQLSTLLKEKQLVIIDFWYVSCEPCKSEFPLFESAIDHFGDKITLLAVNPFDSQRAITNLRKQLNEKPNTSIHFPMLQDACNLSAGFSVFTYPTTVFINADGVILDIYEGAFSSKGELFSTIEQYLD